MRSCVRGRLAREVSQQCKDCSDKWQVHLLAGLFGHQAQQVAHLWQQLDTEASRQPRDARVLDPADLQIK